MRFCKTGNTWSPCNVEFLLLQSLGGVAIRHAHRQQTALEDHQRAERQLDTQATNSIRSQSAGGVAIRHTGNRQALDGNRREEWQVDTQGTDSFRRAIKQLDAHATGSVTRPWAGRLRLQKYCQVLPKCWHKVQRAAMCCTSASSMLKRCRKAAQAL